jgi:TatD DNase family protein
MFVDSHCHLSFPELQTRLPTILDDMRRAQVDQALCVCTTLEDFDAVHALARDHSELWASVGVHPDNEGVTEPDVATLVALAGRDRVVAIGETGLDYYRLNGRSVDEMEWQRTRLRVHVRAAHEARKPLIIHTRSASDDTLRILVEEEGGAAGGVFHCFTETQQVADAALEMGFYLSFSGILTFKTATDLREVARRTPLERCLIETDSPYLAPVPFRGKTNTPALVPHVAAVLAQLHQVPVETVAAITSANFRTLFGVPAPVRSAR